MRWPILRSAFLLWTLADFAARTSRAQLRLSCMVAVILGFCLLEAAQGQGTTPTTRVWTDVTGRFKVEAQLITVDGEAVRLRCEDGRVLEVSLAQLSAADAKFARDADKPPAAKTKAGVATAEELERIAQLQGTARQALAIYSLFLSDPALLEEEKESAKTRLAYWEKAAIDDLRHVGSKWISPEELDELEAKEDRLISEAGSLFESENFDLAENKFKAASRINPHGIRADFFAGMITALFGRDAPEAQKYFRRCVERRRSLREVLLPTESANLIASLNNLAITEIRQRNVNSALRHWEEAVEMGPPPPQLVQNLGRLGYLSRPEIRSKLGAKAAVNVSTAERRRWQDLYTKAARSITGEVFDPNTGWLYIPFIREPKSSDFGIEAPTKAAPHTGTRPTDRLRLVSFGTGFVVSPGYILTNDHVARDMDGFCVIEKSRPDEQLPATIYAVAEPNGLDLAVLHCPDLTAPPIHFACTDLHLGEEIRAIGYPAPDLLGTSLKVTRGVISGLPPHEGMASVLGRVRDCLLYDALTNPGSSGGPCCNKNGAIVAVHAGGVFPQTDSHEGKYAYGVPADRAVEFLEDKLPGFALSGVADKNIETFEAAVELVGTSTVQILLFKDPEKIDLEDRFADARQKKPKWDACEDPWCMGCHGHGVIKCPNRECRNGTVERFRMTETPTFPGAPTIVTNTPYRVRCGMCKGKGLVKCPHCTNGIDPVFFQ
ncbi:MAG: trypsin-like peptidase domain-containing protein [Pirellulaceae bacterium]